MKYIIIPLIKWFIYVTLTPICIVIDIIRYIVLFLWELQLPKNRYWACASWDIEGWGDCASNQFTLWSNFD